MHIQYYIHVPLKSKLPVSSRFSGDESRLSICATLISWYKNLILQESLKQKFWNITEFLTRRKTTHFLAHLSCDTFICASFKTARSNSGWFRLDMYVRIIL